MSLPLASNATADIYRFSNAPPAAPDVAAVPIHLVANYQKALEKGEGDSATLRFTHVALVDVAVDARDGYSLGGSGINRDHLWVPDKNGTRFNVVFVERKNRQTPQDHKKIYLLRQAPTFPTNNL